MMPVIMKMTRRMRQRQTALEKKPGSIIARAIQQGHACPLAVSLAPLMDGHEDPEDRTRAGTSLHRPREAMVPLAQDVVRG
jgi:hypothetical protein